RKTASTNRSIAVARSSAVASASTTSCSSASRSSTSRRNGSSMRFDATDMALRRPAANAALLAVDGAEVPVGERVVVDVEGPIGLRRDLEVRALPAVGDADEGLVRAAFPDPVERHVDPAAGAMCELSPGAGLRVELN